MLVSNKLLSVNKRRGHHSSGGPGVRRSHRNAHVAMQLRHAAHATPQNAAGNSRLKFGEQR